MNSAGRWLSAKPTRNPHGVKEKEVLFFEGEFPQLHSISFLFPIFLPESPPHASAHLPDPHFLDLSHLSLKPSTYPSPRQQNRELFLTSAILPAFPQSQKRLISFDSFRAFLLSSSIDRIGAWSISHREFRSTMSNLIAW